ncbi:DUF171-domain-containing protein [Aspergillus sclerotioniger CBS 115572]|uniref:deoxyribose-phosphate aldolase n=1 Tax=Aspergillus sclerotioniger CBS 115572 TaxID=1450535 RepID=A0A317W2P7_9EURO|nr:DUF171-domain-containing protein [Aspergillus sclerotioniger CBS 115572]PWY79458.1 DUF171-domain-containing protein [Aspergillus sclerotioniger CBS 115572]
MSSEPKTYVSGGRVLSSPPLTVRIARFFESVYVFIGLYFVSLFSLDPYTAAQNSRFNVTGTGKDPNASARWGGGGGSWGPGGGGGGPGGPGRRIGRVDDVRGPECKSCELRVYRHTMSTPQTDAEWATLISSIQQSLPTTFPSYDISSAINRTIDHTQLSLTATDQQIDDLCQEAIEHQFATVCVRLNHVSRAVQNLHEHPAVGIACVVGFHEGTYKTTEKTTEAKEAVKLGASELDMVLNYPLLQEGKYVDVYTDVLEVRKAAPAPVGLKVILETSQLTREQIVAGSVLACIAGADYIKTSTGFNGPGASVENVAIMRATANLVGKGTKVKASGGVRSGEDCRKMLEVGAERIGSTFVPESLFHPLFLTLALPLLSPSTSSFSRRSVMRRPKYKKRKTTHEGSPPHLNGTADALFTEKPSATFTPKGGRSHTLSIAIPGSIIANAHSIEQKTLLAGIVARALAVFCVDEVIIIDDDENGAPYDFFGHEDYYNSRTTRTSEQVDGTVSSSNGCTAYSDPSHFLAHVLSYLETPPYLRKHLFPIHPNLRTAGLLPSLDMPHHLRVNEWCDFREGIVVSGPDRNAHRSRHSARNTAHMSNDYHYPHHDNPTKSAYTTIVDTGLSHKTVLPHIHLPGNTRVTVRYPQHGSAYAEAVHPSTPRAEAGYYWGYYVRRCRSLSTIFTECPFDGGYDLSFGTSERGVPVSTVVEEKPQVYDQDNIHHRPICHNQPPLDFQNILIVFGGVAGIEAAVRNDPQLRDMEIRPSDAGKLFDYWVNFLPGQGSRTIRTEEAVWMGLMSLHGLTEGTHRLRKAFRHPHACSRLDDHPPAPVPDSYVP